MPGIFEVFPALHGPHDDQRIRFFWSVRDPARQVVLRSGCGFSARADARADALAVQRAVTGAPIVDADRTQYAVPAPDPAPGMSS